MCAFRRNVLLAAGALAGSTAALGAGVYVTGHDPDFHAFQGGNTLGAQHLIQAGVNFVTNGVANPSMLLVTDRVNPGGGYSDPELGLTAAGYVYDVADDGSAGGSVLDLHTVNFSQYNVIVVASDFGGWLRQSELEILNARAADIAQYVNFLGGGVLAFAESPGANGLTTHNPFGFLPFLVTSNDLNQGESGFTVSPFGASLGLTNADVNGNASHNIFVNDGGLTPVDFDAAGNIITLAGRVAPEPGAALLMTVATLFIRRR